MSKIVTEKDNQPLAYRKPEKFRDVIGQQDAISIAKRLIRALWGTAQSGLTLLFEGPHGVGKTLAAKLLFKWMRCERQDERLTHEEPCGTCDTCKNADSSPFARDNLLAYYNCARADEGYMFHLLSTAMQIDTGAMRIFDEIHALHPEQQDKLLDGLEALPSKLVIVACTNQPEKLSKAFADRFKTIHFSLIEHALVSAHLKDLIKKLNLPLKPDYADVIAYDAAGHVRTAVHQLQKIATAKPESLAQVIDMLSIPHPLPLLRWIENLFVSPEEADKALFDLLLSKNPFPILRTAMDIVRYSIFRRLSPSENIVLEIMGQHWEAFKNKISLDDRLRLGETLLRTDPAEIADIGSFRLKSALMSAQLCPPDEFLEE